MDMKAFQLRSVLHERMATCLNDRTDDTRCAATTKMLLARVNAASAKWGKRMTAKSRTPDLRRLLHLAGAAMSGSTDTAEHGVILVNGGSGPLLSKTPHLISLDAVPHPRFGLPYHDGFCERRERQLH